MLPVAADDSSSDRKLSQHQGWQREHHRELTGSLPRSIHVLILSRIARSQLPVKHASGTRVIPHFTHKLSQHQGCPIRTLSEQGSIREGSPDRSLGPYMYYLR